MNCKQYRGRILLSASGELKSGDALAEHLNTCTECSAFAKEAMQLTQVAREALPDAEPSASTVAAILQAAEMRHRGTVIWFPAPVMRLTAYAALFLMMAGGATWFTVAPSRQQASRISELSTMVAMVSDTLAEDDAPMTPAMEDHSLEAVARQLLEMEGFTVDDLFGGEEEFTLSDQPDPTTTQYRRTRELPAEICV
jgi:hypothetical protein